MKDLIIGSASNYSWDVVKYWVNSIKQTGFDGDIVLVGSNIDTDTIKILEEKNVKVILDDKISLNNVRYAPHVERFFFLWKYLNSVTHDEQYRYVITTDTRDVIFQKNPSLWLENNLKLHDLVASTEGLKYKDEPWGNTNLYNALGEYFYSLLKEKIICNVGVIAGKFDTIKGILLLLFQLSLNRSIPVVDQAVYNLLLNTDPFEKNTFFSTNSDGWAVQLGTTKEAIQAGFGDIGVLCKTDPSQFVLYQMNYIDHQPKIQTDIVCTNDLIPFTIVHQYDRIPSFRKKIQQKYGD